MKTRMVGLVFVVAAGLSSLLWCCVDPAGAAPGNGAAGAGKTGVGSGAGNGGGERGGDAGNYQFSGVHSTRGASCLWPTRLYSRSRPCYGAGRASAIVVVSDRKWPSRKFA